MLTGALGAGTAGVNATEILLPVTAIGYDELIAFLAQLAVPNNEPVNP